MNLPNRLTLARIIMIPAFVAAYYLTAIPYNFAIAAGIFALAAFTDFLDGYIARKYNLVTNMGKFLDPIADKVLVSTALIILLVPPANTAILPDSFYPAILVALILARELIVSGFRLVAAGKGAVIAADKSGKIKTFVTDLTVIALLIAAEITPGVFDTANVVGTVMLCVSALLTVISGTECIIKNASVLSDEEKK